MGGRLLNPAPCVTHLHRQCWGMRQLVMMCEQSATQISEPVLLLHPPLLPFPPTRQCSTALGTQKAACEGMRGWLVGW